MALPLCVGATAPSTGLAAHIAVIDGQLTTTTRDIAEVFVKRHDDVLRIVRQRMAEAGSAWCLRNFTEASIEVPNTNGGTVSYPVIRMTEKGFMFVVQKFTGKKAVQTQIAYVDEFERMRDALRQPMPSGTVSIHAAPTSIDVRALLLEGQSDPTTALPPELQQAIDLRAWTLAHEAYGLVREHLARRVEFQAVAGTPRRVNVALAQQVINEGTLATALTRTWHNEMAIVVRTAEMTLSASLNALESIRTAAKGGAQ